MSLPQTELREQVLEDVRKIFANALYKLHTLSPEEAAQRAWHPGSKYTVEELTQQIRAFQTSKAVA